MHVPPVAVYPEGGETSAPYLLHGNPLETNVTPCLWVVEGIGEHFGRLPLPAHHSDRPLVGRRDKRLGRETGAGKGESQPLEACLGKDDGIVLPLLQLAQAGVDVSPQGNDLEVRVMLKKLCPSPCAGSPDDANLREGDGMDQEIGRRVALQDGTRDQALRPPCRDVLCAVHGSIDSALQECIIECPDKDTLSANLVEGHTGHGISKGRDDHLLCLYSVLFQESNHPVRLGECKGASAGANQERHCLYAVLIVSTSPSVCAAERKLVSNWEGGRNIPDASIFSQNCLNAPVSHSFASL